MADFDCKEKLSTAQLKEISMELENKLNSEEIHKMLRDLYENGVSISLEYNPQVGLMGLDRVLLSDIFVKATLTL